MCMCRVRYEGTQGDVHVHAGHRDLKPSNLLASPGGRLLLIDFGSAAAMGAPGRAGYRREASPVDPNWAAPEGFVDEMNWAAFDVYSVGLVISYCILYYYVLSMPIYCHDNMLIYCHDNMQIYCRDNMPIYNRNNVLVYYRDNMLIHYRDMHGQMWRG